MGRNLKQAAIGTVALIVASVAPVVATAQGMSCGELWYARNQIYKDAGYCFKTARAIRTFGNANCSFDRIEDVSLAPFERAQVADIQREERYRGCPR